MSLICSIPRILLAILVHVSRRPVADGTPRLPRASTPCVLYAHARTLSMASAALVTIRPIWWATSCWARMWTEYEVEGLTRLCPRSDNPTWHGIPALLLLLSDFCQRRSEFLISTYGIASPGLILMARQWPWWGRTRRSRFAYGGEAEGRMSERDDVPWLLRANRTEARYDAVCKRMLSEKAVLAWILRECTDECRGLDVSEITRGCIGERLFGAAAADLSDGTGDAGEGLDSGEVPRIYGLRNEDTRVQEGSVFYDMLLRVDVPARDGTHVVGMADVPGTADGDSGNPCGCQAPFRGAGPSRRFW